MDFGKLVNTAKKVWDNGGKEIVESLVSKAMTSDDKKQAVASNPAPQTQPSKAPAPVEPQQTTTPEVVEVEVVQETTQKTGLNPMDTGIMKVKENMTKEDDEKFVESLQNGFSNVSAKNPAEAMMALKVFAEATSETIKFVKQQEVKRTAILAERDKQIAQIEATKEILKEYLEKTFDERRSAFCKYFEVVDAALENGDNAVLSKALDSINSLASSSPFKDLSNMTTFKQIMNDSNEDLDI